MMHQQAGKTSRADGVVVIMMKYTAWNLIMDIKQNCQTQLQVSTNM